MTTIHDVARHAGVSVATVSRVLNNSGTVRTDTRARVLAVIDQLDYHPSAMGQSLRLNRTRIVMVVVPEVTNPFVGEVVYSMELAARSRGYSILLHEYHGDQLTDLQLQQYVSTRRIDGLIFLTAEAREKQFQQLAQQLPTILACEYVDHWDIPSVSIDNIAATLDVMRYLMGLGHTRILLISGSAGNVSARDRLRGYRIAHEQAGLPVCEELLQEAEPTPAAAHATLTGAVERGLDFTAVFCASDVLAIGALRALQDKGLAVPRDVSVVGFDDIMFAPFLNPALTTVHQPAREIGERAIAMWLCAAEGKAQDYPVTVRHELRIRDSCAVARR